MPTNEKPDTRELRAVWKDAPLAARLAGLVFVFALCAVPAALIFIPTVWFFGGNVLYAIGAIWFWSSVSVVIFWVFVERRGATP